MDFLSPVIKIYERTYFKILLLKYSEMEVPKSLKSIPLCKIQENVKSDKK